MTKSPSADDQIAVNVPGIAASNSASKPALDVCKSSPTMVGLGKAAQQYGKNDSFYMKR